VILDFLDVTISDNTNVNTSAYQPTYKHVKTIFVVGHLLSTSNKYMEMVSQAAGVS